jgi:transcriptional regulator with XRE-family HTH domain
LGFIPDWVYNGHVAKSVHTRDYDRLRALLIEARKKTGLSQAQLARRLSRPQSFVSKFERGERRLDIIEFKTIAEALDLDAVQLIRRLYREAG